MLGRFMTNVDQVRQSGQRFRILEIELQQFLPTSAFLGAGFGIAVAGKINEVDLVVDEESSSPTASCPVSSKPLPDPCG